MDHNGRLSQESSAERTDPCGSSPYIEGRNAPALLAEWTHAIAQQVFRRQMTVAEADRLRRDFDDDRAARIWRTISVPETALDVCAELGRRYGPKLGIRTLDSLHVACVLELKTKRFWTFDE